MQILITQEKSTINGIDRSVINFVIVRDNLIEHIDKMNIDDQRVHVLTKNTKKNGTSMTTKSYHNIIETRINQKCSPNEANVIKGFKLKDPEAQAHKKKLYQKAIQNNGRK